MRVGALTNDDYVPADIIVKFLDRDFLSNRGIGAPRCGGALEMSMSSCMCEPMETAQSLDDDSHAVVTRPKWAWEHGLQRVCGPLCRGVVCLAHRSVLEQGRGQKCTQDPDPFCERKRKCVCFLFYRNCFWDKNNFIKPQFHPKPRSSKTTFIKLRTFIKKHFHPKPCSPADILIQKHFTEKHFHPKHFHPNSIPVCWRVVWWVGMSGGAGWVRLVQGLVPVAGGSPSGGSPSARFRAQFFFYPPKCLVSVGVLESSSGTQSSPSGGSPSGGAPSARLRPQFFCFFSPKFRVSVGVLEHTEALHQRFSIRRFSISKISSSILFFFIPPWMSRLGFGFGVRFWHTEALHQEVLHQEVLHQEVLHQQDFVPNFFFLP